MTTARKAVLGLVERRLLFRRQGGGRSTPGIYQINLAWLTAEPGLTALLVPITAARAVFAPDPETPDVATYRAARGSEDATGETASPPLP